MLDNGYSLMAMEILNWGNFQGLQRLVFREVSEYGGLFAPPSASAILGVNGSGKSTLIDGLMMTVLPFENSLKLGVTNDAESGGSGGRTIRDYVLGKFSSIGDGSVEADLRGVFGRKDGCSIFLIQLQHNRFPDRKMTLGRIWWYQNFKVNDSQLAFLQYDHISIQKLCPQDEVPKSPKIFKEFIKEQHKSVQVFETMQSYFMALSNSLGNLSKDDLKILNRAFYVKSISQIDAFIRENMLIEEESPHLERLLENVRNGQEIAVAIEACNAKIGQIQKILKDLDKIRKLVERKVELDRERRLLILFTEWMELKRCKIQFQECQRKIADLKIRLPVADAEHKEKQNSLSLIQIQIAQNNLQSRLHNMETEMIYLGEKIKMLQILKGVFDQKVRRIQLRPPRDGEEFAEFQKELKEIQIKDQAKSSELSIQIEEQRRTRFEIDQESAKLKKELEHLSKVKSLLPQDLYEIKEMAIRELKLPEQHLLFVGELIQVKESFVSERRAIESVLFGISRNLLCHPDSLVALTKWLDAKGLRSDVTVKRIQTEELKNKIENIEFEDDQILGMIEVLPQKSNPFYEYLWRWVIDIFNYRLVEASKFRYPRSGNEVDKLVTREGLVKADRRTMRKPKQNFPFSLGWDNSDYICEQTANLVRLQSQHAVLMKKNTELTDELHKMEELRVLRKQLIDETVLEIFQLDQFEKSHSKLQEQRQSLLKENPDYFKLKSEAAKLEQEVQTIIRRKADIESQMKQNQDLSEKLEKVIPSQESSLTSSLLYSSLLKEMGGGSEVLEISLGAIERKLSQGKVTRVVYETELDQELTGIETQTNRWVAAVTVNLSQYRRLFNDPNLPYELIALNEPNLYSEFVMAWQQQNDRLLQTELPEAEMTWRRFFDRILMDSVKDTINEIRSKIHEIEKSIEFINNVLKLNNFEDLLNEQRYLRIDCQGSQDERIRRFRRQISNIEKLLAPQIRSQDEGQSQVIMDTLLPFVEELQKDIHYRSFVTDVRNHFVFKVYSLRREAQGEDTIVEIFTGAKKDAKSSAQTTQLAYALLASCLAYRFKFHDPNLGKDTPRILVLDEFGGKFDNEKPKDILRLLSKMGFQSILVSPMSKAELLAENINQLILVHKVSASQSKARSFGIQSRSDYEQLLHRAQG